MRIVVLVAAVVALVAGGVVGWASWGDEQGARPVAAAGSVPSSPARFACDRKDTAKKGWVLAVHVRLPGKKIPAGDVGTIRRALWETDQTFDASARRFGESRRIRFIPDAGCRPMVASMTFPEGRNRAEIGGEFVRNHSGRLPAAVRKAIAQNRVKLLLFVADDAITTSCTGGGADAGLSNGGAILPRWCWGEAGLTHEFGHSFGLSHCGQNGKGKNGNDPLCRNLGTRPECVRDAASNYLLDSCRTDEFRYFEPKPLKGRKKLPRNRNVAFSPYLISGKPTATVHMRLQVAKTKQCLDGGRTAVILLPCRSVAAQTWQRRIDKAGYVTLRNLGTGKCLQMATKPNARVAPVVSAACAPGKKAQQWVPSNGTNFANRTGGMKNATLAVQNGETRAGTLVVRGGGTELVQDFAVRKGSAARPALRRTVLRSVPYGKCLTVKGGKVVLGACSARWQRVPTARLGVGLLLDGKCLTLGATGNGVRSLEMRACDGGNRNQLWMFRTASDGSVTIENASLVAVRGEASQSDQVVVYAGNPAKKTAVHAGVPYPDQTRQFRLA